MAETVTSLFGGHRQPADTPPASWPTVRPASCLQSFAYASPTSSAPSSSTGPPASMPTIASQAIPQETPPLPLGCATGAAVRSTRYERYSRQMPLQTICATFEGRREPRRRVRRMSKPSSRDRRSRGSRLVRLFRPQNCGAVAHALAETGRVEDDRKLSRFRNGFYLQGDRSTTYAKRAADCKLARLSAPGRYPKVYAAIEALRPVFGVS